MVAPPESLTDVFVGREAELDSLREQLVQVRGGLPRVVLIEGSAGMGKTALVNRFLQLADDVLALKRKRRAAGGVGPVRSLLS